MHTRFAPLKAPLKAEVAAIRAALATPWPYVLTLAALIWALLYANASFPITLTLTVFAAQLALLGVVDMRTRTLPHLLTGLLALTGLILSPLVLHTGWLNSVAGGALAFGGLFGCMLLTDALTGRASLGGGDLWLTAAIGLWLGAGGLPMFALATAATGAGAVLANRLRGKRRRRFPFGPALAAAGWLAVLYQAAYWHAIQALTA